MTDQSLTHVYFLLDRSGSMQSIKTDIEGGFAAFIEVQQQAPGSCRVTLAQFDDRYEEVYADVAVDAVPPLDLRPRNRTALHDAMARLINDAGATLAALDDDARPGTVIVAIMTDGHENASREWTGPAIKALVEQQTTQYGWDFMYLGADQDAVEVGAALGVQRDHALTYSRGKSREAMALKGEKIRQMRASRMTDAGAPMPGYTAAERSELAE